jgi:O-antigen ligase
LAIGLEQIVRGVARAWVYPATVLIGFALLFTQTRTALLSALVVCLVALGPAPGRPRFTRARAALLLCAVILLLLPVAAGTGLVDRTAGTVGSGERSTSEHLEGIRAGIASLVDAPLGHGLGTSPSAGLRFDVTGQVGTENYYLQVGAELGIVTMAAFVALVVVQARRLRACARGARDVVLLGGVRGAALGLAVGCMFLHVWLDFVVAWTCWGAAGAALGIVERSRTAPAGGVAAAETTGRIGAGR